MRSKISWQYPIIEKLMIQSIFNNFIWSDYEWNVQELWKHTTMEEKNYSYYTTKIQITNKKSSNWHFH